ncbi:MAG TPA: carbamoyl-phosphate synthase large subunit, partial [Clostridia bacterium]
TLDYVVVKVPKWPFDKFVKAKRTLGTQMKATGEVMSISSSFEAAFMKAIRSLELGLFTLSQELYSRLSKEEVIEKLKDINDERIFIVAEALRRGVSVEEIHSITKIDEFFVCKLEGLVSMEEKLKKMSLKDVDAQIILKAKKMGFTDAVIASFLGCERKNIKELRKAAGVSAVYKMVDTCAAEFEAVTPYYYSTYDNHSEVRASSREKVLVIGSGPIRIGQGIEFDYCSVHSVWALKEEGYETIIANNNPETVSTDFDTSDRLYFEPLTHEDVENIVETEKPAGAIVQFGGQTAIKLTKSLNEMGVRIFGTEPKYVDAAEDREKFDAILEEVGIPRPSGRTVYKLDEALDAANSLGYPVLVRPSYVLGGQGMEIAYNDKDVIEFMEIINRTKQEHPILVDKYMMGKEIEVDAICDGEDILIPGIMEHLERAGVHSGDSISVYPTITISQKIKDTIVEYTRKLAKALHVIGLINIQYVLYNNNLYVIEVNPRSSRTVPYISKVTGIPMVNMATKIMMGKKLSDFEFGTGLYRESDYYAVKVPVFSFEKLHDVDISLGPEMKSTGEVLGIAKTFNEALYKGIVASGIKLPQKGGGILMTVRDTDKQELLGLAEEFEKLGFELYATGKTANTLNMNGIATNAVKKIDDGSPNILDLIQSGKLSLVVNTPTKGRKPDRDGFKIRRKSVEMSIPCLTSLDTVKAVLECMKLGKDIKDFDIVNL